MTNATTPGGTVKIYADDATCVNPTASCTATVTGVTASCSISNLATGSHSITAIYSGDTLNEAATSAPLAQQVNPAVPLVPAPTLGRWAMMLLGGLLGLVARFYRRAAVRS